MDKIFNPYAIHVRCDGAMNYGRKNIGGAGFQIDFPDHIKIESQSCSVGRFEGDNIETLELRAINEGMNELLKIGKKFPQEFIKVQTIIFVTDRISIADNDKTNAYAISGWRKNNWHSHDGRPIKNDKLLDQIDKKRKKIMDSFRCRVEIKYTRRKYNKSADNLAKAAKENPILHKSANGRTKKIGQRLFSGPEINYSLLKREEELFIYVFLKDSVGDLWEIWADIYDGQHKEKKIKFYLSSKDEMSIHRKHYYKIMLRNVYKYHVEIGSIKEASLV